MGKHRHRVQRQSAGTDLGQMKAILAGICTEVYLNMIQ
jgi:hypothetical protein